MARRYLALVAFLLSPVCLSAIDPGAAKPPEAPRKAEKLSIHGETRIDEFFWLKDKKNPEVVKYLEAENAYFATVMKPTEEFQTKLYKEFLSRIKQTDQDVPVKDRGYWYYTRTVEGKQYPIRCRKKGTLDAKEEVLLDGNELAKGEKFFSLGGTKVSDDGNLLAYSTDTTGFREYLLSVKDLRSGKVLEEKLVKAPQFEWAADNKTLYYTTEDDAKRADKVWCHTLGDAREKDTLAYEERDPLFWLELSKSRDGKYLFHASVSYTSTEQRYIPADAPHGEWKTILKRGPDHEYSADHHGGHFYILTNKAATNFKVVRAAVGTPGDWEDFVGYDPVTYVEGISLFKNHLVLSARVGGEPKLIVRDLTKEEVHSVEFDEHVYDVSLSANPEFDTTSIRFTFTNLTHPDRVFEYDMVTRKRKELKNKLTGAYFPNDYVSERVKAIAADGTSIPISLVYKKGLKQNGTAGCLLYAYGSYGYNVPMAFDTVRVSMLDRGVVFAHAHIRGGSDLGRTWYDDGKMLKKMNTFTDFIACADHLVKEQYCSRNKLVIQGGSAGGLLVGVAVNLRPDLCKAAVLKVPFVDAITTMLDESLPLTVQEFQQWGNPKVKEEYDAIRKYCPYTNLKKGEYPSVLVTTSLNDSQVMYHEPAKYVAKLRTLKTDKNPLLFRCNMDAGHGGASGRYDYLKEEAMVVAFVLDQMGITK